MPFLIALPIFLTFIAQPYASPEQSNLPFTENSLFANASQKIGVQWIEKIFTENPNILAKVLLENPEILSAVFESNPDILWQAQQKMIADFSEKVSHDVYKSTARILKNSPELWDQMQKSPLNKGHKHIILFLDPLCPHSIHLFKDMLALVRSRDNVHALCPHWVTEHHNKKSQMIARALMAAHALGKLEAFLELLLDKVHALSADYALQIATQLNLDQKIFQQHMFSPSANEHLLNARSYGNQFQFQGFPTILYKKNKQVQSASPSSRKSDANSNLNSGATLGVGMNLGLDSRNGSDFKSGTHFESVVGAALGEDLHSESGVGSESKEIFDFELIEGHPDTPESLRELLSL